eukprot:g926.t1
MFWPHRNTNATALKINQSITYQNIEGFGGAFTDSSTHVFDSMPANLQDQFIELYFGESGLKYNMGRLTIGSCDFSMEYYNYDDVKGDVNLTHFNISHDEEHIIPFIQRAVKASNTTINFVASPWSAPAWMKKNNHMNCDLGPWTCVLKDDPTIQQSWAKYFSKYIDSYKKHNVNIWGVTIQNEPEAQTGNIVYEGMHFTPETEKAFLINHLGPVMKSDHPDVNILIYDHNKRSYCGMGANNFGRPKNVIAATAMKTPNGKTVIVAMNQFDGPLEVTLEDPEHGEATTTLLPHSIATFVY